MGAKPVLLVSTTAETAPIPEIIAETTCVPELKLVATARGIAVRLHRLPAGIILVTAQKLVRHAREIAELVRLHRLPAGIILATVRKHVVHVPETVGLALLSAETNLAMARKHVAHAPETVGLVRLPNAEMEHVPTPKLAVHVRKIADVAQVFAVTENAEPIALLVLAFLRPACCHAL